jgi:hypothetical protein
MHPCSSALKGICLLATLILPAFAVAAVSVANHVSPDKQESEPVQATILAQNSAQQSSVDWDMQVDSPNTVAVSLSEIATEISNPVSDLIRVENDFNYFSYDGSLPGASDQGNWIIQVKPHIPFTLSNGKSILFRLDIPIILREPVFESDAIYPAYLIRQNTTTMSTDGEFVDQHSHLEDIGFDVAYGGVSDSGLITMYGVAGAVPVSTDTSNSKHQLQLGPEFAIGKVTSWGLYGAWLTHLIDVVGEDSFDTNITSVKVLFAYGFGNGWQIFSNPVISYDWAADSGNKLFLPIGAGISKTMRIGNAPLKLSFELQKYLESPDFFGPDLMLKFSVTPVLENPWSK